jgi:mannosyltransferase PIG-V
VATGQRVREPRAARAELTAREPRAAASPVPELFLWTRTAIWAAAVFALLVFEPNRHPRAARWDDPSLTHDLGYATDVWARWDSVFFLRIAEHGYDSAGGAAAAFYPLYPALVGVLGRVFLGHYVLAGIVISLAASLAASFLLYRLTEERLGAEGARRAVLYLAVFPMALFLQAVYSESLFLLLALAAFALAERGRFAGAGAAAGLALLTRVAGLALLPALALIAWRSPRPARALAGLALAPVLFLVYPLHLWLKIGDPWAFAHAQEIWNRHLSPVGPLGGIWDGLRSGWAGIRQLASGSHTHPYWTAVRDSDPLRVAAVNLEALVFLALFLTLAIVVWRRFGAPYGLFAALSLALPLSAPSERWPLLSLPRFGLVVFPFFLALAALGGRPRIHTAIVTVSSIFLGVAIVQWSLWQWVA